MSDQPRAGADLPGMWQWITSERAAWAGSELARELRKNSRHPLFGLMARAIAQRQDRDDFLFEVDKGSKSIAIVHLTFRAETNPLWPRVWFFESFENWLEWAKLPQHD